MADYAPPTGPPPPKVPEGWRAIWNDQYKEWFYVNLHTKASQWEPPTAPVYGHSGGASHEAPPSYDHTGAPVGAGLDTKKSPFSSDGAAPYHQNTTESDEAYARRLQEEENARNSGTNRGASDGYYQQQQYQQQYPQQGSGGYPGGQEYQQQYPPGPGYDQQQYHSPVGGQSKGKGGFLDKIKSKIAAPGGSSHGRPMGAPMMGGYGGHQQHGYGGYPQPGYGGGYGGYGGGYGQPMMRRKKPGMGAGGAAALGVGGGLVGGMLLADALDDSDGGGDFDDGGGDDGGGD